MRLNFHCRKMENVPTVLGFLKIDSYPILLFQLPNPLLQDLPLWFLLGLFALTLDAETLLSFRA